jgi:hypothetical protein
VVVAKLSIAAGAAISLFRSTDSDRRARRWRGDEVCRSVRAVDTNVLARYYLADDPAQARVAKGVLESGAVFIPKTVMLELAWVLKSVAEQPAPKALECLRHLVAPGVTVEDGEEVHAGLCAQVAQMRCICARALPARRC